MGFDEPGPVQVMSGGLKAGLNRSTCPIWTTPLFSACSASKASPRRGWSTGFSMKHPCRRRWRGPIARAEVGVTMAMASTSAIRFSGASNQVGVTQPSVRPLGHGLARLGAGVAAAHQRPAVLPAQATRWMRPRWPVPNSDAQGLDMRGESTPCAHPGPNVGKARFPHRIPATSLLIGAGQTSAIRTRWPGRRNCWTCPQGPRSWR